MLHFSYQKNRDSSLIRCWLRTEKNWTGFAWATIMLRYGFYPESNHILQIFTDLSVLWKNMLSNIELSCDCMQENVVQYCSPFDVGLLLKHSTQFHMKWSVSFEFEYVQKIWQAEINPKYSVVVAWKDSPVTCNPAPMVEVIVWRNDVQCPC